MYQTRFGLRQRPFRATPDTAFYYPATGHERALAQVVQAISDDEGLMLLSGEPGTGKTLLGHCLLERLGSEIACAFLTNTHVRDRSSLFQGILYDLSLPYEGRSEQELRLAFTDYLLKNCAAGRRTVLLIDEAQHLGVDLLEELRLFGNLEARSSKAIQVILVALPCLEQTLKLPELAPLQQRLAVRVRLEPLGVHEAADYLVHQLRLAGGRPEKIISDEALGVLANATQGIPRLLNQAAHQALALAQASEAAEVDAEIALEALAMCGLASEEGDGVSGQIDLGAEAEAESTEKDADCEASGQSQAFEEESSAEADPEGQVPPPTIRPSRLFAPPRRTA
jgi:type II secretory pathway predicted ATPase ExeA